MNPMLQNLNQSGLKNALQMVKAARDPYAMLNRIAAQNPGMKNAIDYVKANGGDAKAAFYKMAQEKGIDPESILSQLR